MTRLLLLAALVMGGCEMSPEDIRLEIAACEREGLAGDLVGSSAVFCRLPGKVCEPDQTLRAELFQACLKALPAGQEHTKYNDWAEVVEACENAAYWQSKVCGQPQGEGDE